MMSISDVFYTVGGAGEAAYPQPHMQEEFFDINVFTDRVISNMEDTLC